MPFDRVILVSDDAGTTFGTPGNPVNTSGGGGGGGAAQADKSAFTEGTTSLTPIGGVLNETPTADPTEDQAAAARITAKRALHVNLRNNAGTEIGTATTPIEVAQPSDGATTGTITAAGQTVVRAIARGEGSIAVQITGTWTATLQFEHTIDDTNWIVFGFVDTGGFGFSTATTANGIFSGIISGQSQFRIRASSFSSGTANVTIHTSRGTAAGLGRTQATLTNSSGVEVGIAGSGLRIDPLGTTAQPVTDNSGSLTVDAPTATPVPVAVTTTGDVLVKAGDSVNNAVRVNVVAGGGGGGGASQADESAFTEGTTSFTPIGGVLNDAITSDPTEDQAAAARITAKRGLHVNLRNVGGTELGIVSNPVQVQTVIGAVANRVQTTLTLNNTAAETTILAAPGANTHYEIDALHIGSEAIVDLQITLRSGTAGTIRLIGQIPNGITTSFVFPSGIAIASNTLVSVQLSAAVVADVNVNIYGQIRSD